MTQGDIRTLWDYYSSFGEAPSIWDDFVEYILELVATRPAYYETVRAVVRRFGGVDKGRDPIRLKDARLDPWLIVDEIELKRLAEILHDEPRKPHGFGKTQNVYSAAAVALWFLNGCTKITRNSVRRIVLIENEVSIAQPACHARGFIPLCQENAKLHVERRVSLWQSVWPVSSDRKFRYLHGVEYDMGYIDLEHDRLCDKDITGSMGIWLAETMALPSLGMPVGSYTLVLDGNPTLEHTSSLFRIVQRDAAWQAALDTCYSRGVFPTPSWLDRRRHGGFICEGLPSMVRALSHSKTGSLISCNFDPGTTYDIEEMLEDHRGWSWEMWEREWSAHEPRRFQTEEPLPPWHILRWGHVLP